MIAPLSEQLSLPGLGPRAELFRPDVIAARHGLPERYKMFFALFPPPADVQRVADEADAACSQPRMMGSRLTANRLHVTQHVVGDFHGDVPMEIVDAARAAAATVACAPLHLVFDQVMSFAGSGAFVLRCDADSDSAIARLRKPLIAALRRVGLGGTRVGTPHMTLAYDKRLIPAHPIKPIQWTATEFSLVLSHSGHTHHQRIAQWPLID